MLEFAMKYPDEVCTVIIFGFISLVAISQNIAKAIIYKKESK